MKKEISKNEKNEIIPIINTKELSYRDVLVKGRNKEAEDFMERRRQNDRAVQELLYKAMEAMSLSPLKYEKYEEYENYDLENYDDLPDAPQEELTEAQQDQLMWESFCEAFKGTEAGEYFSKAFKMLERGS